LSLQIVHLKIKLSTHIKPNPETRSVQSMISQPQQNPLPDILLKRQRKIIRYKYSCLKNKRRISKEASAEGTEFSILKQRVRSEASDFNNSRNANS
jgi:hypothetical protein